MRQTVRSGGVVAEGLINYNKLVVVLFISVNIYCDCYSYNTSTTTEETELISYYSNKPYRKVHMKL